jgi:hypothetical protein
MRPHGAWAAPSDRRYRGNEIFVVWLSVSLTAATRSDGFESDTDAALAQQSLWGKLGLLLDLTWLESE